MIDPHTHAAEPAAERPVGPTIGPTVGATVERAVELRSITKCFGALRANASVSLHAGAGEVLALLGENGAGKSTLMKILYGLYQPDAGQIIIGGQPVIFRSPADAIAHGIGMVTQHFALVSTMTVAENIALGAGGGLFNRARAETRVRDTAARYHLQIDPAATVCDLSVGEAQRVEILKALSRQARVLILDEPTAVLTPQESRALFGELKQLVAQGLAIIFISHKLDEVLAVADRVTVLRDGSVVGETSTQGASAAHLAEMMVGRAGFTPTGAGLRAHPAPPSSPNSSASGTAAGARTESGIAQDQRSSPGESPLLAMHDVHTSRTRGLSALRGVTLDVRAGEIVGIAGVSGNGQTELAEVLTGMRHITQGSITLLGHSIANVSAAQATASGIGRIPEDRQTGLVGDMTVAENMALEHVRDFTRAGKLSLLDQVKLHAHARALIAQYNIKAAPSSQAGKLSGGTMQKIILARVLSRNPMLVVAAQPTRGLDVGASEYVRGKLIKQRERGAGVLLISEDLDELLALADRIAVMFEGRIIGSVDSAQASAEQLGLMMAGRSGAQSREVRETQHV